LSEQYFKLQKGYLPAVSCECGLKMSIVPDLAVMGQKIEEVYKVKIYKPNVLVLIGDSVNLDHEELIRIKDR